jgi:hypothetical protein
MADDVQADLALTVRLVGWTVIVAVVFWVVS